MVVYIQTTSNESDVGNIDLKKTKQKKTTKKNQEKENI